MVISGELSEFPVDRLLRQLARNARTGVLEVCGRSMRPRRIRLERGHIAEATSDSPAELIAELRRVRVGTFRFRSATPGDVTGVVHDTIAALEQSDALLADWLEVDLRLRPGTVVRPAPRDESQDWRLDPALTEALAALGTGAADRLLATRLGISTLAAARLILALLNAGLVVADTVVDVTALEREAQTRRMAGAQPV